ncbi:MAG: DNA-binding response regulator [Chloroflexota bacterium]|nr:MAG: DNA-binding response regulator [Chloroflexota bacterium]
MLTATSAFSDYEGLRLLIVARNPFARVGLASLLAGQAALHIVGECAPDSDLASQLERTQPEVVLWDLDWEADAAALSALSAELPPILALLEDAALVPAVWASGALGMLLRNAPPTRIAAALGAVAQRLTVLDPQLANALLPERVALTEEMLTNREREVLRLLSEGLANKSIAMRLGISENTVKFHVNAIMSKLGAQSRTEAVVRAARLGLIAL